MCVNTVALGDVNLGTRGPMSAQSHIIDMHQSFYRFWLENCTDNGFLDERDAAPKRFKALLPNIVKIRATEAGPRFSVVGTQVVDEYKQDFTGLLVDNHPYDVCRAIYLSLIQRMNDQQGFVNCHGLFCYENRHYLRTMESAFALLNNETSAVSGYLVLVTVDHTAYANTLYSPTMPINVASGETAIYSQADFDQTMRAYQGMTL